MAIVNNPWISTIWSGGGAGGSGGAQTWTTVTPTYYPPTTQIQDDILTKEPNVNAPKPQIKPLVKIISDTSYLSVLNHPDGSGDLILAEFSIESTNQLKGFGRPKVKFETRITVDLEDGVPYFYSTDRDQRKQKSSTLDGLIAMVFL